ncbi:hypothetical protein G8O24_21935 [Bradyrhizobium sp. INPA01-394B]|jgi:hypothetical protein|uniref:Uncharacterized protein n=1 Tax=Bradyrhizobium campsiandrae TaxID=1729892 RepID=A0ABR7UKS2_9BRAD|nr:MULTISPECIES: hypothetical protein [Bradyrhizobium]MBC9879998.1 hypothetical protein [Bradyrhizobium campsiandrae]MBC9984513.1 hypothetical protein [Bradyrhizobium campsiandrae]MBR1090545.1 hypothetical protein [Bradyrhizobium manausense]MDU1491321.1 hypothetical protein [Bradyrhizobium sp.]MDU1541499.1 hypothetical protein [Bradyrhizobium sp.]
MRAWLDEITEETGHVVRTLADDEARAAGFHRLTDYQLMRMLTEDAAAETVRAARRGRKADDDSQFLAALAPFFARPDDLRVTPFACAVGRDLAPLFAGAGASEEVVRRARDFAREKFAIYIDVAEGAFRLGQTHQLRAVFVYRVPRPDRYMRPRSLDPYVPDASDRLRIFAVAGAIGGLACARASWVVGSQSGRGDDLFHELVRHRHHESGLQFDSLVTEIEDLVWLTLAYAAVAQPDRREILPMATINREGRLPNRAARRRQRGLSLFRVERLRAPADNFGRRVRANNQEGWQLGRRIRVRGHFKMQRHGTEGRLRKLIFVASHCRGPLDAAPLHSMRLLD